ncbi:rhodanese-like domain-containing protein [Bryobacter aggregatus]|uniref:rhodanese-like domain-containing protein n=1 Tax=Bryobacter aggregatus TaxID=360054 RepID=UPI0004E26369|nr:rhodanese-like domain-containing protein [Bryobacter aggregatus]
MSASELAYEIEPRDFADRLSQNAAIAILDCRETWEHQAANIAGAELIPMNTIPANLQQIEALAEDKLLVVYCHHGVRSLHTVAWLRQQGIGNAMSLSGGIDRWSMEIDPKVPRY